MPLELYTWVTVLLPEVDTACLPPSPNSIEAERTAAPPAVTATLKVAGTPGTRLAAGTEMITVGPTRTGMSSVAESEALVPPTTDAVTRALAVVVSEDVPWEVVREHVQAASPQLIESIALCDEYRGEQVPAGHKSLAFSICLRSGAGTLEDKQADLEVGRILRRLETELNARLRQ